jgi:hypothetical protein
MSTVDLHGRHFLTLSDYSAEEILYLLDLAAKLKAEKKGGHEEQRLAGKEIALIFEKDSTCTRFYRVDDRPVLPLCGSTPTYRSLSQGASRPDVAELSANLVHFGYATRAQLDPTSHQFSAETASAIRKLQSKLGEGQSGARPAGERGEGGAPLPGAAWRSGAAGRLLRGRPVRLRAVSAAGEYRCSL